MRTRNCQPLDKSVSFVQYLKYYLKIRWQNLEQTWIGSVSNQNWICVIKKIPLISTLLERQIYVIELSCKMCQNPHFPWATLIMVWSFCLHLLSLQLSHGYEPFRFMHQGICEVVRGCWAAHEMMIRKGAELSSQLAWGRLSTAISHLCVKLYYHEVRKLGNHEL